MYAPALGRFGLFLFAFLGWGNIPGTDPNYVEEIKKWQKERIESLKSEQGWLNLAGLYWLKPGSNTFGAGKDNQIVFPEGKADPQIGKLILENGTVWAEINSGSAVFQENQPVQRIQLYGGATAGVPVLRHRSLRWFIIKRGDKYGVRLRDLEHPNLTHFAGIESYPIQEKWRLTARLEVPATPRKIAITDVLGQTADQDSPGTVVFELRGKTYRLDAVDAGDELFILFGDKTNLKHTYQSGRFVYAKKPGADGVLILDFNKAYNPPCAFTDFATCPLPPTQNLLPVAISAGEKRYGEGH